MTIFVDTGPFYALVNGADAHAESAREFFKERWDNDRFVTSDAVLFEAWRLIRGRLGWDAAAKFLDGTKRSGLGILFIDAVDLEAAGRILAEFADQELSLTGALSFALMERRGLSDAFSFDKDFLVYRYGPKRQRAFTRWPR